MLPSDPTVPLTLANPQNNNPESRIVNQRPCIICEINKSKYSCPRCLRKTCSLACFNRHRQQLNCSGKSDVSSNKAAYIKKGEITGLDIQRDYNFLNKVARGLELGVRAGKTNKILNAKRSYSDRQINSDSSGSGNKRRRFDDESNVIVRRGVKLKQLPNGMSRKSQNKSGFDSKKGKFMWTLEWLLVDENMKTISQFISFKNPEDSLIENLVPFRRFIKILEIEGLVNLGAIRGKLEAEFENNNSLNEPNFEIRPVQQVEPVEAATKQSEQNVDEAFLVEGTTQPSSKPDDDSNEDLEQMKLMIKQAVIAKEALNRIKLQLNYYLSSPLNKNRLIKIPKDLKLSIVINERTFIEFPTLIVSLNEEFESKEVVMFGCEDGSEADESSPFLSSGDNDSDSSSDNSNNDSDNQAPEEEFVQKIENAEDDKSLSSTNDSDGGECANQVTPSPTIALVFEDESIKDASIVPKLMEQTLETEMFLLADNQ